MKQTRKNTKKPHVHRKTNRKPTQTSDSDTIWEPTRQVSDAEWLMQGEKLSEAEQQPAASAWE